MLKGIDGAAGAADILATLVPRDAAPCRRGRI